MTSAIPKLHKCALACVVVAISLALAMPATLRAQSTAAAPVQKSDKTAKPETRIEPSPDKTGGAKSVAAKRQKLRDCGTKWQDEKKVKDLTGKAAYLKFLSACLKN
jgi:hypothetical protein